MAMREQIEANLKEAWSESDHARRFPVRIRGGCEGATRELQSKFL
jgi:hypothetical protein